MSIKTIIGKARNVKFLLLDVDGVMTDGSVIYDQSGNEIKAFSVRDGAAIKWLQRAGIEVGILSGRNSAPLAARAKELGIEKIIQGTFDKLPAFENFCEDFDINAEDIAYIGDDLHDLPVLKRVALSACPADAVDEVRNIADYICKADGGRGVVREVAELLLKSQKKWTEIIGKYQE
jgi:3-deoxy-D-manno-octulosonate 8-phosphate phosphatase (KDO 8-P phosphatase)